MCPVGWDRIKMPAKDAKGFGNLSARGGRSIAVDAQVPGGGKGISEAEYYLSSL